jgi:CheY-like chemotaxis protein
MVRVLVVDDDPAVCELLKIMLSEEGHDVRCVDTIGKALDAVRQQQPDVILFDMMLSDGGGEELVRQYRLRPLPHARLIAVSGIVDLEAEALRIGTDAALAKPFDINSLFDLVGPDWGSAPGE